MLHTNIHSREEFYVVSHKIYKLGPTTGILNRSPVGQIQPANQFGPDDVVNFRD